PGRNNASIYPDFRISVESDRTRETAEPECPSDQHGAVKQRNDNSSALHSNTGGAPANTETELKGVGPAVQRGVTQSHRSEPRVSKELLEYTCKILRGKVDCIYIESTSPRNMLPHFKKHHTFIRFRNSGKFPQ
ncbi:hypothetical protein Cfor_05459, partial [Coptotermes formosanus]